jgi:hypothetical protein
MAAGSRDPRPEENKMSKTTDAAIYAENRIAELKEQNRVKINQITMQKIQESLEDCLREHSGKKPIIGGVTALVALEDSGICIFSIILGDGVEKAGYLLTLWQAVGDYLKKINKISPALLNLDNLIEIKETERTELVKVDFLDDNKK